jgi:hypothetical protein
MSGSNESRGMRALRLSALITGGILVAALAFAIYANFLAPSATPAPKGSEWFGLAMFPFGVFVAYVLAFRWGTVGGAAALLLLLGWWAFVGFKLAILVVAAIVAIPGILYVVYGVLARGNTSDPAVERRT